MSSRFSYLALLLLISACGDDDPAVMPPDAAPPDVEDLPPPQSVDCTHHGSGVDYRVGPNQPLATLGEVPWETLGPGDTVRIFWRAEAYHEKAAIITSGTADQPIRVCGVPGPNGELPVLDASDATTRSALGDAFGEYVSYSMQQLGILVVWAPRYGDHVEHVAIEGLHFTSTMHAPWHAEDVNSFVDWDGVTRAYDDGAAGIRIQRARELVLRGNVFTHLNVGIYAISQDFHETFMVRNVLVEGNLFRDNALVEDYDKHQAYLQGTGFVIQFNYFGNPTPGSWGNDLKMRTAGDVIRYNYFENGAHALDLVDVEDHVGMVMPWQYARLRESLGAGAEDDARQAADWSAYHATYVFGNVIHLIGADAWADPIHYGFDNSPYDRRPGTLWFYFNTVVYETDFADRDTVRLFSCCSDFDDSYYGDQARLVNGELHFVAPPPDGGAEVDWGPMLAPVASTFPSMRAIDNAIVLTSATAGAPRSDFELGRWRADQIDLGRNWITSGWNVQDLDQSSPWPGYGNARIADSVVYPGGNDAAHVVGVENLVTGTELPIDLATFAPVAGGPLMGAASDLPVDLPAQLRPTWQIRPDRAHATLRIEPRMSQTTLGAIE